MVRVGDKVKKGDVIFEIETDKAAIVVESPADGFANRLSLLYKTGFQHHLTKRIHKTF